MKEIRNVSGQIRGINKENREVTFESSNTTKDRHRTVLNQRNWNLDNFNSNGIIGYQHNVYGNDLCEKPTPDDVIGKGYSWVEGDKLLTKITFKPEGRSDLADKVYWDVENGYLNSVSVGFLPFGEGRLVNDETGKETKFYGGIPDGHTYHFEGQELLEVSVVNIPSNPTALKKSFRDSTARALTYLIKAFDGKYSLSELDEMKVRDIINLLSNDEIEHKNSLEDEGDQGAEDAQRESDIQAQRLQDERDLNELDLIEIE